MEGDEDELEDSDSIPRLLEDVQSVHVVSSYFVHANPPRHLFHSAPPIVRRLFEGGVYSRKYGMQCSDLTGVLNQLPRRESFHLPHYS